MIRPRIIGTRLTSMPGASRSRKSSKASACALGMSRKKKLGAFSGKVSVSWRLRFESMRASVTRRVMPRPSDSTRDGVSAPGR
jgi:hypothetical protein